jgi:hypothetical protein
MEIHKPKAAHSWREFLIEIGTIVCGILIALALEQSIEWLHWKLEVSDAREGLREEIAFDERVYMHRVDVAPCVKQNLALLRSVLEALRAQKRVAPIPVFISPENGPIRREIWNSASAAQILVHFPKAELQTYSQFYQQREDDEYFMDRESRAWRQLHALEGDPNQLSRQEINALWVVLGDADEMSHGVAVISKSQLEVGRSLGIVDSKHDAAWRGECRPVAARP